MDLTCEEALFGGAAGGGKSECLLMWLAEGIHIPGYTGGIFRRHIEDLSEGNSSIIAKSMRLYPALGGQLVGYEWRFPSGAVIVMSGMAYDKSVLKQQGKEYHRAAFDELTHFTEYMYDFVYTTRMRKVVDFPIKCGVRASANPGGPGHEWVKARFITNEAMDAVRDLPTKTPTPHGMIFWVGPDVAYVPSRAADNPTLDVDDYIQRMLRNKNPVERARMMNGDWSVAPEGLIKANWLRYYVMRDRMIDLLVSKPDGQGGIIHTDEVLCSFHESTCRRFSTIDTAGGMKDITDASKGKNPSWTVIGTWDHKVLGGKDQALVIRDLWRDRQGFTDVANAIREVYETWKPHRMRVENATMGPHLVNLLRGDVPLDMIDTGGKDKVTRAGPLLNMMEQGFVYLPKHNNTWRPGLESEYLGWQGIETETNDQIDMSAYAAIECGGYGGSTMVLQHDPRQPTELPKREKKKWW